MIDLVRLHCVDDAHEAQAVGELTIVGEEALAIDGRVIVKVVDTRRREGRRAALYGVDLIVLFQKQSGQIRAVLSRYACDQRCLGQFLSPVEFVRPKLYRGFSRNPHLLRNPRIRHANTVL